MTARFSICADSGLALGSGSGTGLARTIRGRMTMAKMAFMVIVVTWLEIGALDEVQKEEFAESADRMGEEK